MEKVYVVGAGAVGLAFAACLVREGREAVAVRTTASAPEGLLSVTVRGGGGDDLAEVPVESVPLARLPRLDGLVAVAAKSPANPALAAALADKGYAGPVVILQNGLGVEAPFLAAGFASVLRGVLYVTGQPVSGSEIAFRAVSSSPVGVVQGSGDDLARAVRALSTPRFPFHAEADIARQAWRKTAINAVFNSICPLLETDNGIFVRDPAVAELAREMVRECVALAGRRGVALAEDDLTAQIAAISRGSQGRLISTLQDLRNGRETEIDSLNLELARIAAACEPPVPVPRVALLGALVLAKSRLRAPVSPS